MSLLAQIAFAALAIGLPGLALQRLARGGVDPALVIPLGSAACAGLYWLSIATDLAAVFPAGVTLLAGSLALPLGPWRRAPGPSLRGAVPPLLAVIALLALSQFRFNRIDATGDFVLDPLVTFDSAFHVGLSHELAIGHPPQVPGVAGFPLGYHLGTDLVRAAALRWAGIDPWDSLTRFDVTLWAAALVLALRAVAARLRASPLAVSLAPWTLLLTDFSWVFAANPQAHWWADLLRGNLLLSLAYSNPVLPALGLALVALVALSRHLDTRHGGWLALAALAGAALPFFKVFLGAQLLLGLGLAFLLARPSGRMPVALAATPCAVATASLVLGQGGETVRVVLAPLDLAAITRETLGLPPLAGLPFAAWSLAWIAASLGLRLTAIPEALRSLRGDTVRSALAAMALCGWPLGLLFRVSAPEVLPGQKLVNDAAYLVEQSGPLLWLFAAMAAASFVGDLRVEGRRARLRFAAVVTTATLLATPSTLQYVTRKVRVAPDRLPAPMVRAMAALERVSQPGDVVLQRPGARYPPAPVVLAGRRVPYERFTPYLTQFATPAALQERHRLVYTFFRTREREEAIRIARHLRARFLALYGRERVRFDTSGLLEVVHEEEGARLFRFTFDEVSPGLP